LEPGPRPSGAENHRFPTSPLPSSGPRTLPRADILEACCRRACPEWLGWLHSRAGHSSRACAGAPASCGFTPSRTRSRSRGGRRHRVARPSRRNQGGPLRRADRRTRGAALSGSGAAKPCSGERARRRMDCNHFAATRRPTQRPPHADWRSIAGRKGRVSNGRRDSLGRHPVPRVSAPPAWPA
jgi:hypothetical protein